MERALKSRAYTDFDHIDEDADLDGLRNDADFKALVKQYRDAWEAHLAAERKLLDPRATEGAKSASTTDTPVKPAAQKTGNKAVAAAPHGVSEIAFTRTGGVTQVPCTINGLPLHFVFDTGASEVTLSSVEAQFMFKNGYLKPSDVIGRRAYLTASGDVVEGTSVRLHSVTFGGLTLNNVRASITHSQAAPAPPRPVRAQPTGQSGNRQPSQRDSHHQEVKEQRLPEYDRLQGLDNNRSQ